MRADATPSTLICVVGEASGVPGRGDTVITGAPAVERAAAPATGPIAPTTRLAVMTAASRAAFSDTVSDTATQVYSNS